MSELDALVADPAARRALAAHAARLKHDLGKYVAMQQRWLPPDHGAADLEEALRADLLSTRRGPDGTVDAGSVWAEFRPALFAEEELVAGLRVDLSADEDVRRIDRGMAVISTSMADIARGNLSAEQRETLHGAALDVSDSCRALARRLGDWARRADG